jgi:hypothetical protein
MNAVLDRDVSARGVSSSARDSTGGRVIRFALLDDEGAEENPLDRSALVVRPVLQEL